jgi:hypothetical protein
MQLTAASRDETHGNHGAANFPLVWLQAKQPPMHHLRFPEQYQKRMNRASAAGEQVSRDQPGNSNQP